MEEEINKILKPNKIRVVVFVIFLAIAITGIVSIFYFKYEKTKNPLNLAEQISNGTEKEGQYVKVNIAYLPQIVVANREKENYLYLIKDEEEHLYIARLSNKTVDYLKSIANEETGKLNTIYPLEGATYHIDSQTETLAIRASKQFFAEKGLTSDNFSQQVGTVYIHENRIPASDGIMTILKIFVLIGVFLFVVAVLYILPVIISDRKLLKNTDLVNDLKIELRELSNNPYGIIHLYLTKKYIFSYHSGKQVIKYEDIIWAYVKNTYEKSLIAYTKDKKKHVIVAVEPDNNILEDVIAEIQKKNPNMRFGYSEENVEFFQNFTRQES